MSDTQHRSALLVVDPKGDLIMTLLAGLAAVAPHRLEDVRLLDPFAKGGGFSFNLAKMTLGETPVDIRALQLATLTASVSTAAGAQKHLGSGARQIDVIQNVILGALTTKHPAANLIWALEALLLPRGLKMLAALSASERARLFLSTAYLSDELRASSAARLRLAFAPSDDVERMISASDCIQWADVLAPGRICLVDLGRPTGGLRILQEFYANVICRLAFDYLLERPSPWRGHHVRIVLEEAQVTATVLADCAETLLTRGRSLGLSVVTISQGTVLLREASDSLLGVLLGNTPMKLVGRLAAPDAEIFAREQAPRKGIDESVSEVRTKFVTSITNLDDREFVKITPGGRQRFISAEVDLAGWNEAVVKQAEAIRAARTRLNLPEVATKRVTLAEAAAQAGFPTRSRSRAARHVNTASPAPPITDEAPRGRSTRWG